jgi:putative ABC transport system permease protein
MSVARQTLAVVGMNLRNLPRRTGASLVIVIGIAGVVGVLISILAMAVGFASTIDGAGSADRALILSSGAPQAAVSSIQSEEVPDILQAAGIAKDAEGRPIAAAEALAQVQVEPKGGGEPTNVALRGVAKVELELRPEIHLLEGRMFRPGLHELMVGHTLEQRFHVGLGSHLLIQDGDWLVVGVFASARPSLLESEIFADAQTLLAAYQRTWFNSVTVRLADSGSLERLKNALASDPTLHVSVYRESTYAASQLRGFNALLTDVGYFIGGMMAVGAVFGALNSLYASVSGRSVEIATLRAIGFGSGPVVISVMSEALLLSIAGGLIGALCAWMLFNGHVSSMLGVGQQAPITFALAVTPGLLLLGVVWACVIGFVGGLFPAIRAAHLPVARALNTVV